MLNFKSVNSSEMRSSSDTSASLKPLEVWFAGENPEGQLARHPRRAIDGQHLWDVAIPGLNGLAQLVGRISLKQIVSH